MRRNNRPHIAESWVSGAALLVPFQLFLLITHISYRVQVYDMIQEKYPDLAALSLKSYMLLSMRQDALVMLLVSMAVLPFLLFWGHRGNLFRSGTALLLIIIGVLFAIGAPSGLEFFRIYETTFDAAFLGKENLSGLSELLHSITGELSAAWYAGTIQLLLVLLSTSLMSLLLSICKACRKVLFPAALLFTISTITAVIIPAGGEKQQILSAFPDVAHKKINRQLKEFSASPVMGFFSSGKTERKRDFSGTMPEFHFTTDSPTVERIIPRSDLIPRTKAYNVVFFIFESTPMMYLEHRLPKSVAPRWHEFMEKGYLFPRHYTSYPLSANALVSLLHSIYAIPWKEFLMQKYPAVPLPSLPELLHDEGYRTFLIHTGHLGYANQREYLDHRSFDRIIDYNDLKKMPPWYGTMVGWGADERALIEPALSFMKESDKPFFAILMPTNPHHPYEVPEGFPRLYEIDEEDTSEETRPRRNWQKYQNSLHYADHVMGQFIDRLEEEGLLEDTLVCIMADHGEAFYNHPGNYNHPFFIYEENVHVPMVIYSPQVIKKGARYSGISRHIDVAPTLLDLLNIDIPEEYEGIPLFNTHQQQMALLHTAWRHDYSGLRDGRWKFIYRHTDDFAELYDLEADPGEKINLAAKHPERVKEYREIVLKARSHKENFYGYIHHLSGDSSSKDSRKDNVAP